VRGRRTTDKHKPAFDDEYVALWERVTRDGEVPGGGVYESYLEAMAIKAGDRVLDLGVGYGRLLPSIRRYTENVVGVDLSERMLHRTKEYDESALVTLGDACLLPFGAASFDHVICWAVWENIPQAGRAVREVGRVLRPGGRWLVSGKNLMNRHSLRLAYHRRKRAALRRLWPEGTRRALARRILPRRIVQKLDNLWPDRDIPQYPTFFPVFGRQLQAAGLTLTHVDHFAGGRLTEDERLPQNARFSYYYVAIARKD